jgi:hypothetical protein
MNYQLRLFTHVADTEAIDYLLKELDDVKAENDLLIKEKKEIMESLRKRNEENQRKLQERQENKRAAFEAKRKEIRQNKRLTYIAYRETIQKCLNLNENH